MKFGESLLKCILLCLVSIIILPVSGAGFSTGEFAIAAIIGGLLKPKLVPFPILFPFPFKIQKHVQKPYQAHKSNAYANQGPYPSYSYSHEQSQTSGTHALAELQSASENIESFLKQLSLSSSDIIKESETLTMPNILNGIEEYERPDEFSSFSEEWWRK